MKKIFLTLVLVLIPLNLFCVYWWNGLPVAYVPPTNPAPPTSTGEDPDTKYTNPAPTMDELTIRGASYFLKSTSGYSLFLQKYELNSGDIEGLKTLLNESIINLEKTIAVFSSIDELASKTHYNPAVLYRLSIFDYDGFRKEKGLYPDVFKKVSYLLRTGNISGTLEVNYTKCNLLLKQMNLIMQQLNSGLIPEVWKLWEISQDYTYLTLFGQYASMVFKDALNL